VVTKKPIPEGALSERAQHFLRALIRRYIREGQPVGSRTLAKDTGLDLSPATVRNVMADLEEMGLVSSPHTSAGRVPTIRGYRLFVDCLLTLEPLDQVEIEHIRGELEQGEAPSDLLESASQLLSGITNMAGVVMVPRRDRVAFRHIEFLPLSNNRVLTILVTNEQEVHNRIIHTRRVFSRSELEQAANYLNQGFKGEDIRTLRDRLVREMSDARERMNDIMVDAVEMAGKAMEVTEGDDCVIAGQTNLMEFRELADMEHLRQLFDAFSEKREILHLLDECLEAEGVEIFIGEESGYRLLDDCSVVTAPYEVDDQVVGVLGVIGPTRMAYEKVIPVVDVTAKLLGAALKQR